MSNVEPEVPMNAYQQWALMNQVVPEYSTSKGWLPIDQGTLKNQINMNQDNMQWMLDPFNAAMMGAAFDPQSFEPTVTRTPVPQPLVPKYQKYSQSSDPVMSTIFGLITEDGLDPYSAAEAVANAGLIERYSTTPDGKSDSSRFDALVKEAEGLQSEAAEYQAWEAAPYTEESTPSAAAKPFTDAGAPMPTERYTAEMLGGEDMAIAQAAFADRDANFADQYAQLEALRKAQREPGRGGGAAAPVEPSSGEQYMGNRTPGADSEDRFTGDSGRTGLGRLSNTAQFVGNMFGGDSAIYQGDTGPKLDLNPSHISQNVYDMFTGGETTGSLGDGFGLPPGFEGTTPGGRRTPQQAEVRQKAHDSRQGSRDAAARHTAQKSMLAAAGQRRSTEMDAGMRKANASAQAKIAEWQGRTPFVDWMMQRAGM